tara:strand:+ start:343 stop:459 length:117 start_codon:yes stop_codon:yes gene_type:complete
MPYDINKTDVGIGLEKFSDAGNNIVPRISKAIAPNNIK